MMNPENTGRISSDEMFQWCKDFEKRAAARNSRSISKLLKRFPANATDEIGNTLLLHYVSETEDDNDEIVKYLFEAGFEVNDENYEGQTALINAVIRNKVKTVKTLINLGAITDQIYYSYQIGPLHCAAKGVCIEILKLLVDAGCNVNAKDKYNNTPLDYIINSDSKRAVEVAKILIDAGASRDHTYYWGGVGPLYKACKKHNPEMVELLLDSGFKVSIKDNYGDTPLHWSMHKSTLPYAVTANDDDNAADDDNVTNVIKLLIEAGADVNSKRKDGKTPLHLAVHFNYCNAFDLLREAGAELDAVDNRGYTPLHMLGQFGDKHISLAKRLVESGCDFNKVDNYGRSCIFNVVRYASVELLTYFIQRGSKLDLIDCYGMDLLVNALLDWGWNKFLRDLEWNFENENRLSNLDANVEKKFGKDKIEEQIKCLEILCKHGIDVNRVMTFNNSFYTALTCYCHSKIIRALLRQGAIVNFNHYIIRRIMNDLNSHLKLQQIIIQHVAMDNLYKNGKGLVNFSLNKLNKQQVQDYENCVEELKTLKNFCVYESMPLLNLIEGPVSSRYILNDHLSGLFEIGIIANSFPMFYEVLRERFEEEREKYELILKASSSLQTLMKFNERSYDHIYRNILSYLKINDHRNLASLINMEID